VERAAFLRLTAVPLAAGLPAAARAQSAGVLRVASTASDSYAEGLYAQDVGFFKQAGMNVELSLLSSGAAILAAVVGGAIDIGITNAIPFAAAVTHGVAIQYLCAGGMYNPDEVALCVASDSPIRTYKDLEGRTIATSSLTDINVLAVRASVDANGGDSSKLRFVEIPFATMAAAAKRGTVDAAPIVEPALSAAQKEGGIRLLRPHLYDIFGKDFLIGGWFATTDWIGKNRATARAFNDAIYRTARWANAHPEASSDILAKYAKLDPATLRTMARAPYGYSLKPPMIQSLFDLSYKYKIIDRPIKAADIIAKV
jgi:NitT/TauT family transport system substrate-binding protein